MEYILYTIHVYIPSKRNKSEWEWERHVQNCTLRTEWNGKFCKVVEAWGVLTITLRGWQCRNKYGRTRALFSGRFSPDEKMSIPASHGRAKTPHNALRHKFKKRGRSSCTKTEISLSFLALSLLNFLSSILLLYNIYCMF